jgi:NADH-quinone oxidoreductase subunit C
MMTRQDLLQNIQEKFQAEITSCFDKSPKRVYFDIKSEAIVKMARYLYKDLHARFNIASGIDDRSHLEILYHFTIEDLNLVISLRVKLDKAKLEIDSITPMFEGANWIEREIHEMFGINFKGHPNLKRLLLPDEWPEGVYPLRREYQEWDKDAVRDRGV